MRTLSSTFRNAIEAQNGIHFPVAFLTVTHSTLGTAVRLVNDTVDYVWKGNTYTSLPFDVQIMSDDDRPPSAQLIIPNIDISIGVAIAAMQTPPQVQIDICNSLGFNLTVTPRVGIGVNLPNAEYTASGLYMLNISVDAIQISGELSTFNYVSELWPGKRCVQALTPGIYR